MVSVITAVRNGAATIARQLSSVASQTVTVEHIIIDGASTDETLDIVRRFPHVARLVSEPDRGIADAWNKGLRLATSPFVCIANADDVLSPTMLECALKAMAAHKYSIAYADVTLTDSMDRIVSQTPGHFDPARLYKGIGFLHPGCVATRDVYDTIGGFDPSLRYAMDCDWLIRAHRHGFSVGPHEGTCYMRNDGMSNVRWFPARREYIAVLRRYNESYMTLLKAYAYLGILAAKKTLLP